MARAAKKLLLDAVPSLEKNHDLLLEMLVRPDDFTLGSLGCSVREFLEKNGADVAQDPRRMKFGAMIEARGKPEKKPVSAHEQRGNREKSRTLLQRGFPEEWR